MSLTLCPLGAGTIYSLSLEGEGWGEGVGLANRAGCGSLVFALTLTLSPRRGDIEPGPFPRGEGTLSLTLRRLVAGTIYSLSLEGEGWGEGVSLANRAGCGR